MSEHLRKTIKPQNSLTTPSPIKFWTSFGNCIYESLKKREWKESEYDNDWDICWVEKETVHELFDKTHMTSNQKVNHFRNHYELTRKDLMIKNLKRYKRALEKEGKLEEAAAFNFFPTSYNLPLEYNMFCDEFKKTGHAIWIMKPIGKSQGKGIFLFKKLSQISEWKIDAKAKEEGAQVENYIVQRYIHNPLLIGGKKFDMRIYCLVTSYSPLVVYLYRDGFARFTHHRYSNSDITNTYVHLTNVAIQKHSENYDKKIGGKWDLRTLKLYLMSKYGTEKVGKCFMDIQFLIVRTLQSVQKVINNDKRCFELYGFDILLDSHLKPWVLEVNGSPSMTANTPQDCELKCGLLDDVFSIIDMEKLLTGQEEQVGGFDLICKGTPIQNDSNLNSSMLGCENNRVQQLKKLAKQLSQKGTVQTSRPPKEPQSSIETRRSINRDSLQPIGGLPLDPAISTKKMRSKSTGKPAVYPGGINVSASAKVPRNIFSQKTTLIPLPQEAKETREIREIKEGREVRERRNSSQNSRLRVYKGKAIDLPPMNNGLSGLNPSSNVTTTLANLNPLSQKVTPGVVADVLSNGSHGINSAASTASHTNSSEFSLKPNQQKVGHQNSLTSSLVMYPSKGLGGAVDSKGNGQVESVLAHLPEISSGKEKNDKNFLYAHWQTQDLINYNLSKQSSVEMKLREGFSRQLKMMGTMENKSELRSEDNTMANSGGLSKDQNSARETGSQVNSEINNE